MGFLDFLAPVDLSQLTFGEIAQLQPFRFVQTPATLPELFAAHHVSNGDVAKALGVSQEFLDRVIAKRQPLPIDLVRKLAFLLSEDIGTVELCAGLITPITGPSTRVALPPDPVLGERFPAFILGETQPIPRPSGGTPETIVWVCGGGLGPGGSLSGAIRIGRNTGLIYTHTGFSALLDPAEIVTDGSSVFTSGFGAIDGNYAVARMNRADGALELQATDGFFNAPLGMVWEPVTGTLWLCSSGTDGSSLVQVDPVTGTKLNAAQLTTGSGFSTKYYKSRDVVALGGLLYVTAVNVTGPTWTGHLFEVDPLALAVLRVSSGLNLANVYGVDVDPENGVFVVTSANATGEGGPGPKVSQVLLSSFVANAITLTDDPETLGDPSWITFAFGVWWVTDNTAAHGQRLFSMTTAGEVLQSRSFGVPRPGGHSAADPWFLWYADKALGKVHVLNPADISASAVVIDVGGAPDGILILPP